MATYGARSPFWIGGGMGALRKEPRSVTQHDRDYTGSFTQVRAAARHKTLLLLWWIDWENVVVVRCTLAQRGLLLGSNDFARTGV